MKTVAEFGQQLGNLGYFYEMEVQRMSKFIMGGLVGSLLLYSLGATYLLCNKKRGLF